MILGKVDSFVLDLEKNCRSFLVFFILFFVISYEEKVISTNVSDASTSARFDDLNREQAYRFVLQSMNNAGYSSGSSDVFLPMASNSKFGGSSWGQGKVANDRHYKENLRFLL